MSHTCVTNSGMWKLQCQQHAVIPIYLSVCLSVCYYRNTRMAKTYKQSRTKIINGCESSASFQTQNILFFYFLFFCAKFCLHSSKIILFLLAMICLLFYIVFFMLHFSFFFPMEVKLTSQFLVVTGGAAEGDSECSNCTRCDLILTWKKDETIIL